MIPEFRSNAIAINISREMALDYGLVQPTPEEATDRARQAEAYRIKVRESWATHDAARPALAAITDPLARKMLDLHSSETVEHPTCRGCEFGGYEAEPPEWPCATALAVAEHYGIAMPDPWHLFRRPTEEHQ